MKKNKFLSCMLVILIFASIFPTTTFAETLTSGDYSYTVNGDGTTCTITGYTGAGGEVTIPDSLGGYTVSSIGEWAFGGSGLIVVTIPGTVKSIGACAFTSCSVLTDVTIPFGVESIGDWAFHTCSELKSVTIPGSVENIGNRAFCFTGLKSVTIPGSIESIGDWAFSECFQLTSVTISFGVERIGDYAFSSSIQMTSVTIPGSIVSIGEAAFGACSGLTSVTIPDSVTSIEKNAFIECGNLSRVYFDGNMPTMGANVFNHVPSSLICYYPAGKTGYDASFQEVTDLKTVAVSSSENGIIIPSTATGMPGETISLKITPDDEYKLKSGSLKYDDGSSDYSIGSTSFTMPDDNITISGEFEKITVPAVSIDPNVGVTKDRKPAWNWTDATGEGYYRYKLNDAAEWTYTELITYTPANDLSDGAYTLYVQELDSNGYWSGNGSASITVNNTTSSKKESKNTAPVAVDQSESATGTITLAQVNAAISKALDAGGTNNSAFTILTPIASISFDRNALETISKEASEDVKFSVSKVDQAALSEETKQIVGDRPVFDFSVTSGDETISQFGGNLTIAVPYTPQQGEDTNAIIIYYINAKGDPEIVSNCLYDPATGTISFRTNHLSKYAVGYNKVGFTDVKAGDWYSKAVEFVAARGITAGYGNGKYSPEGKLTRGQFLAMIMRAYGMKPDENAKDNFSDAGDAYYTDYLSAAKRLGLSDGIGDNKFAPEKEITRQEMFTLLYNTLKQIDELPAVTTGKNLNEYSDANDIAAWAKDAMTLFAKTGTLSGSNGKLAPAGTADRAQMAQILYKLLSE